MNNDEYALTPKGHATSEADQMTALRKLWTNDECARFDVLQALLESGRGGHVDLAEATHMLLDGYVALGFVTMVEVH